MTFGQLAETLGRQRKHMARMERKESAGKRRSERAYFECRDSKAYTRQCPKRREMPMENIFSKEFVTTSSMSTRLMKKKWRRKGRDCTGKEGQRPEDGPSPSTKSWNCLLASIFRCPAAGSSDVYRKCDSPQCCGRAIRSNMETRSPN